MSQTRHSQMTGADLHEPKGVAGAADRAIAQASSGTVTWSTTIQPDVLTLNTAVYDDLSLGMNSMTPITGSAPTYVKFKDNGASSTGVYTYQFDAATEQGLGFVLELPHSYKDGTDITPTIHWAPMTTNTGNVVWGIEYTIMYPGGTFGATTLVNATTAASGVIGQSQYSPFSAITGSTFLKSTTIIGRVFRKAADAADTFTGLAAGLSINFHIQKDKIGSSTAGN